MTTEQRSERNGFRLPWTSDRRSESGGEPEKGAAAEGAGSWVLAASSTPVAAGETAPAAGEPNGEAEIGRDELETAAEPEGWVPPDGLSGSWVLAGGAVPATDDAAPGEAVPARPAAGDATPQAAAESGLRDSGSRPGGGGGARTTMAWPAEDVAGRGPATAGEAEDGAPAGVVEAEGLSATAQGVAAPAGEADMPAATNPTPPDPLATASSPAVTDAPASRRAPGAGATGAVGATGAATGGSAGRTTKFMADLSRAMQAAAQAARDESLVRLSAEAKQRIEQIHEAGTAEAAELRRRADDDLAGTREWSKAEIARVREEADRRIADRKARLETDVEQHAATIRQRTELVREAVSSYERELAAFVDELLGESDPARIATAAQRMPEAPILDGLDGEAAVEVDAGQASTIDRSDIGPVVVSAAAGDSAEPISEGSSAPATTDAVAAEATVAAESEPEAAVVSTGLSEADAAAAEAEVLGETAATAPADQETPADPAKTQRTTLLVTGLSSVAGIAGFKRELSRLESVRAVGVSAGQDGEFVFVITHGAATDLAEAIPSLAAFQAAIRDRLDGTLLVSAVEPEAE